MIDTDTFMTLVQYLGAAVLTYLGVRYTGRRAKEATVTTQASEDLKAAAAEWRALKDDYKERLGSMEGRMRTVEADLEGEREHSRRQDRDMQRLRRQLTAWARWAENLSTNWATIRERPYPPPPPMDDYYRYEMRDHD